MQDDLDLTGYRFNWALSIFYFACEHSRTLFQHELTPSDIFIEIPSNIVLKLVGGKIWIPTLVVGFGLVSLCTAFVQTYGGLLAVRFFLGICEGGVLPGIAYYLSTFYRRRELLLRVSIMIMGSSMAGAFGGLLAAALSQIPRWGTDAAPIHTWRNIFFFEGLVSVLAACLGLWILPNSPASATFLNDKDRQIACERMHREYKELATEKTRPRHVKQALTSVHGTLCAFMFFFLNVALQSFSVFLPTILRDLGYTAIQAQLRSVAPYVSACAMGIFIAWSSDHVGKRGPFVFGCSLFSAVGYAILCGSNNAAAKYAGIFIAAMGAFGAGPTVVSWGLNNSAGPSVRSVTSAYVVSVGNCGALIATWTYLPFMSPEYTLGHALNLTSVGCAAVLSTIAFFFCRWENKKRENGERDHILQGKTEQEIDGLGYQHPQFRLIE
jgi:MFS family permease